MFSLVSITCATFRNSKKKREVYEASLSYLYLLFVMSELWSKIAWCRVPCCQHVTVLAACQRCQAGTDCAVGILNCLLNIPCHQWSTSIAKYVLKGQETHPRGIPKQVTQGTLQMASEHAAIFSVLLHRFSDWSAGHYNYPPKVACWKIMCKHQWRPNLDTLQ